MLPGWFIFVAIILRIIGGAGYIISVIKGKAKPNPISWFLWSLTATVTFVAQIQSGVGLSALMTLALGISPLMVFVISMFKSRDKAHFSKINIACGAASLVGVLLWRITEDPNVAIMFSILADILSAVPTLTKVYNKPQSEYAPTYFISAVSMAITLLTITQLTFANYAYPVYVFGINVLIFMLAKSKIGQHRKSLLAVVADDTDS